MEGLEKEGKGYEEEIPEAVTENSEEDNTEETIVEAKPIEKRKSFFDKFTERFKEFLDNAE